MKYKQLFSYMICLVLCLLLNIICWGQSDNYQGWKAGVAKVKITPDQPMWMEGYAFRNHPSIGTLTDLWAKALALEDANGKKSVLVTMDLCEIPKKFSDHIRDVLKTELNLSRSQIILNVSHTHSGPVLTGRDTYLYPYDSLEQKKIDQYTKSLENKIIALVKEAFHTMQPVTLYAGNGVARFQVNRRNNNEATLSLQTHLNGPNDDAVPVIKVVNGVGKPIAIAFGYACHGTTLDGYKWSGDYAGYAQIALEKKFPGATALFFQGCGGDQNPLPRRSVLLAEQYGKTLANAVETVALGNMQELSPHLSTAYEDVNLPFDPPPTEEELKRGVKEDSGYVKRWASRLLKKEEQGIPLKTSYPYPVEVWRLGDQPIIALGGEVVIDYAIELKEIFGQNIFVLGYSNDVMNYIPTPLMLRQGGYESAGGPAQAGLPSTWRADIKILIFQAILQLANQVGIPIPSRPVE